jgi:endonuclease V-like protein UPF0215 family
MEFEYSKEVRGKVIAFMFSRCEMTAIADALRPTLKKYDKQIEKIRNHPKNEGQCTYAAKIDELAWEKKRIEQIIDVFSKPGGELENEIRTYYPASDYDIKL